MSRLWPLSKNACQAMARCMPDHWLSKLKLSSAYRFTRAALNVPSCTKKNLTRKYVDSASGLVHHNLRGPACERPCPTISTRGTGRIALPRDVPWVKDPAQNSGHTTCGHAQFIQLAITPRQHRDGSIIGKFPVAHLFGAHPCLLIDFRK